VRAVMVTVKPSNPRLNRLPTRRLNKLQRNNLQLNNRRRPHKAPPAIPEHARKHPVPARACRG